MYQTINRSGISLPLEIVEAYGFHEGAGIVIELQEDGIRVASAAVESDEIERRALRYILRNLGDAVQITAPRRTDKDEWAVDLFVAGSPGTIGTLYYSLGGRLLHDQSVFPSSNGAAGEPHDA